MRNGGLRGISSGFAGIRARGLVGFGGGMSPRPVDRSVAAVRTDYSATGDHVFVAPVSGKYDFYLYGPGGKGGTSPGSRASSGGGGGAAKKRRRLSRGQAVSLRVGSGAIGASSTDHTTVTFTDLVVSATRGGAGGAGYVPGGNPGVGLNGDVNRTGGRGEGYSDPDFDPNTPDGTQTATLAEFGGGLGGGAGFTDVFPELAGTAGGIPFAGTPAGSPGGGGGWFPGTGGGTPMAGGHGRIVVVGPR